MWYTSNSSSCGPPRIDSMSASPSDALPSREFAKPRLASDAAALTLVLGLVYRTISRYLMKQATLRLPGTMWLFCRFAYRAH